jgi:hypothetical protein
MEGSKERRFSRNLKATSRFQCGMSMERDQSSEGVWRLKNVLWTCSRGPKRNLLEGGDHTIYRHRHLAIVNVSPTDAEIDIE